jgi:hypothetical protein
MEKARKTTAAPVVMPAEFKQRKRLWIYSSLWLMVGLSCDSAERSSQNPNIR